MRYVDANIILRYVLGDNAELSPAAKDIIDNHEIFVPTEVPAEVVYVLMGVYSIERKEVSKSLLAFIDGSDCELANHYVVIKALELFATSSLDFVDCVLAAHSAASGVEVSTFDKKLETLIGKLSEDNVKK